MELIYNKTNKLKPINKIRKNFINDYKLEDFANVDAIATHFQIQDENNKIVGCVSYYFNEKIIYIYAICSNEEYKEQIINHIKNITKQFNCTYVCK